MSIEAFARGSRRRRPVLPLFFLMGMAGVCVHADEAASAFPTNRDAAAGVPSASLDVSPVYIARNALRDGLFDLAEEHALAALAVEGLEPEERQAAFDVLMRVREQVLSPADFLKEFPAAAERFPVEGDPSSMLLRDYWHARASICAGRFETGLAELEPLTLPGRPDVFRLPAIRLRLYALHALGETEAALAGVRAVTNPPPDLVFDHARLLLHAGRPAEALARVEPLTGASNAVETTAVATWIKAWALDGAGPPEEAGAFTVKLAEDASLPADFRALAMAALAVSSDRAGEGAQALDWAERAVQTADSLLVRQETRMVQAWIQAGRAPAAVGGSLRTLLADAPRSRKVASLILESANRLLTGEFYAEALEIYDFYLSSVPDTTGAGRAQKGRGMALSRLGRHAEAATAYELASEWATADRDKAEALGLAAEAQHAAGLDRLALSTLQAMNAFSLPVDVQAAAGLLKAECQLAEDEARALRTFLETADAFPEREEAHTALYRAARILAGRIGADGSGTVKARALDYYARAAASTNLRKRASATLGAGLIRYHTSDYARALEDFDSVLAMKGVPDIQDQTRLMRAEVLLALGETGEAVSTVRDLLDRKKDSPHTREAVFWMGRRAFNTGDYEQAGLQFDRYVEQWPDAPRADAARLFQAQAQFEGRRYREAIDTAMKLVARNPDDETTALAQFIHAEALTELLQFDAAVLLYDGVARTAGDDDLRLAALARRGDCLFTLGADDRARYLESIAAYEQVIADPAPKPLDVVLQCEYKIGRSLHKAGRTREAGEQYYTRVISRYEAAAAEEGLDSESPAHVWYARAVLGAAEIFERTEQWAAAVAMLERVAGSTIPGAEEASRRMATLTRERLRPIGMIEPERTN